VKATVADWTDAYSIFCIFFTTTLIEMIVQETNRYADEMLPCTKTVWAPVSIDDIMCFFGIAVDDGKCKKADLEVILVYRCTVSNTILFNDNVT